jgi:hypothetical protein
LNEFYCWKLKQITKKWVSKGKWVECVHTWGQQHMLPYLSMKGSSLFCFVIIISPKPQCLGLCYGTYHQKKFNGAPTWFRMFGTIVWNLLIIKPFFHWFFWKTKIENYIGIWGHSWYCWKALTKFDLIKLIL